MYIYYKDCNAAYILHVLSHTESVSPMEFIEIFTYCSILLVARYASSLLKENKFWTQLLVDMINSYIHGKLLKLSLYPSATVQPFFSGSECIGIRISRKKKKNNQPKQPDNTYLHHVWLSYLKISVD